MFVSYSTFSLTILLCLLKKPTSAILLMKILYKVLVRTVTSTEQFTAWYFDSLKTLLKLVYSQLIKARYYIKAKPTISQFVGFGKKKSFHYKCKIGGTTIFSKDIVILLGITIDNKLTVEPYLEKLYTLQRITKFPAVIQAPTLALSFVNSQLIAVCSEVENRNLNWKKLTR